MTPQFPVVFRCDTCQHWNRTNWDIPNFVERQEEFDSLTEAWEHMIESPTQPHHIIALAVEAK